MILTDKKLIARGATADVYEWEGDRVIKLFRVDFPMEDIEAEFDIAKNVSDAGVDTPTAYEIIEIEGQFAIIYERIYGEEVIVKLRENILKAPYYMRQMAITLADLHSKSIAIELPSLVEKYTRGLEQAPLISDKTRETLIQHLRSLPEEQSVCHGDYHVKNVMISDNRTIIIDWVDAVRGNPLMDVARTHVILSEDHSEELPPYLRPLYLLLSRFMRNHFVNHYLKLTGHSRKALNDWLPLTAAYRLNESSAKPEQLLPIIENWREEKD